jgi:glycosyltransferase involved in cell wall biosynthesis
MPAASASVAFSESRPEKAAAAFSQSPLPSCILITPARNEADLIEGTIRSVVAQTVQPIKWLIVSDGSTDGTDEIVQRYAAQHPWIELLRLPERRDRQFAAKAHAFNAAFGRIKDIPCDVIGNLDADITFDPGYLEYLFAKFAENPKLGVAGTPFVEDFSKSGAHTYAHNFANLDHVSGACQLFRRECFEKIGGYIPIKGGAIDWIAVTTARMRGWQTRTFTDKVSFHHRKLGTGSGKSTILSMRFHYGRKAYYVGGHPVWEILRGVFQMRQHPFAIGGLAFISGYVFSALRHTERPVSPELIAFHRSEQIGRLKKVFHL